MIISLVPVAIELSLAKNDIFYYQKRKNMMRNPIKRKLSNLSWAEKIKINAKNLLVIGMILVPFTEC